MEVVLLIENSEGGYLITQIKQIGSRIFERLLADAGVDAFNGPQGRILYVLWQADNIPIVELARKSGLAKTTLTSMLDRMEESGLIERIFDRVDRRQIRISLTATARALRNEYNQVSATMNEIYFKGFTEEEIILFENTLRRILDNITEKERNL
ncbi:MAG: MarR family transcriptional regulator [Lachnospiraceae bacterium]|jgi:DNA-binding MarR family transcriptional regulator|nr:MarR family transcriptional regulator [Lachnospiraceae bacterium]